MKTQFKRFSKSTISVLLAVCLLFSCMTVGLIATSAAQSDQERLGAVDDSKAVGADDKIIFVELSASWAVSGSILLHYWGGDNTGDASLSSYSGSIYTATIPADSTGMKLHWNNGDWYGSDGDPTTKNYAKLYESNGAKVDYGTYQVTSTASLSASKTSATTGENVTLTPGISSNTTYNEYKSVSYSISPSSGASISGNTFTATAAGTYTVTATVTYNAKGFTGITKTATATKQITVTQAATNYTVTYGTVTGYANGTATATVTSGSQVTSGTSVTFTATPTNSNYQFVGWYGNASGTGSVVSSNASYTTTINATTSLYAKFVPVVQITAGTVSNGSLSIAYKKPDGTDGTLTSGSAYILSGSNVTVTATASTGYYVQKIGTSNVSGTYPSTGSKTYSNVTSAATYTATFASTPDITFYVCNDASWSQINYYIYTGNGGSTIGTAWPGAKITSTAIGTIDDKNVYQVTLPKATYPRSDAKCIILSNNGSNQYDGEGAVTLTDGYIYYTNDKDASEATTYSASMLDAPSHNITFTPSPTGGTVTVGGSSTSPTTVREGNTYEIKATPSSGYYVTSIKVDNTSVYTGSMSSTGAKTANGTMGTANQTVTVAFAKITYTGLDVTASYSTTGESGSYNNSMSAFYTPTKSASSGTRIDGITVTAQDEVTSGGVKYKFHHWSCVEGDGVFSGTNNNNGANGATSLTFYPYKSDVIPVALYKQVYTITTTVDDTGKGAGTAAISESLSSTEVVAGGSYKVTATPASDKCAVESITVNNTNKGSNSSYQISSVTANQTVVVKFKSLPHVIGGLATNDWTKPGDEMTSNAAGTSFSITISGKAAGTYDFQHYLGTGSSGTYDTTSTDIATKSLSGIATLSAVDNGYGGKKFQLVLTVTSNITLVSDGTKFTSISVVPDNVPTYNVTLKKVAGSTITGSYMGTDFTTASADATVQVYSGTAINFTVTADSDKYLTGLTTSSGTLNPAFNATTHAAEYEGAVNVTAATTITPAVAGKLKVTCTTNNTSWGTVSTSPEYARPGETVTLTYTAAAGTLKTLTVVNTSASPATKIKEWTRDANGDMKVTTAQAAQSSANQFTQVGLSGIAGSIYSFIKDAGEALGAADDSTAVGDDPLTFNMPAGAVSVTATYEEYVGTSEYIYHGRNTSGQAVSGYENEVMSEGVINGQKYAYYNVSGRGSVGYDQLFYVSKGGSYTDRWVYFNAKGETYGDWYEPYGTNVHAYFYNSSGAVGTAWPGATMTWVSDGNDNDKDSQWKIAIPSGATGVIFSNGKSNNDFKQTQDIDLTNTNGSYYPSGYSDNKYTVTQWSTPGTNSGIIAGTDYYWDTDVYKDQWYTGGFSNHNVNNDHNYAKPKDGNSQSFNECKDDYYIILLYPNTSYTFGLNGHDAETKTTGSKPWVLWSKELPGQSSVDVPTVKVYAKDGAIRRDGDSPERNDRTYSSFEQYANTFVYSDSGYATHIGTRSSHDGQSSEGSTGYNGYTYDYVAKFNKGDTLYIKTVLKDDTFMNKYYLAAYSINGKTYALHTTAESDTRTVTEAFTVPEDWEDKYVEITPIYFLRDSAGTNTITFYIEGYDETVMNAGWGNTPFVYPFYQDANFNYVSNINNAFGGYPGQPMVFYKGNYYIQLPKQITTTISTGQTGTATIKGVTLGNGYWDDIHILTGEVSSHFQTYDYDDLYKIYNEKGNADRIICAFKYRTKKNNDEPASMSSSIAANYNTTNGNGWEVLTNYYGEPVDVFGNVLTGTAKTLAESIMAGTTSADTATVVHAISQDYKSNSAGDYATEWVIYNTSGTKVVASSGGKTSIVPSALAINANTNAGQELTSNFDKYDNATKAFKSIYTALYNDTNVRNKPAVVTYEKSIYGGGDKADRCDARWYFSQKDAPITATTRIEYTDDGKTWNTDTYTSGTGTGSTTGTKAYFTGKASTATDTPSVTTGIDDTNTTTYSGNVGQGYYTIKAENAGQYQFVGWYLLRDNYQNISTRSSYAADATEFPSHAEMSKNGDIFVARFKKTATGTFDIYHEIHPQTTGYGTVDVSAVVKKGDTVLHTYPSTGSGTSSHIQIGNDYIQSGEGNTIVATFTAAPYHTSNFDAFYATVQDLLQDFEGYDYIDSISISGGTATVTYNVDKMFSMASGSPVQTVTNVTHYSKFSLKDNLTYSLEYTFNTRYYDTKLYKYTNVAFTEQELRSYFLDQITDPNCDHIKLDKQFVKAKAPFESNFREDLTWVVDDVTFNDPNDPTIGYLTATQVSKKWATAMVYDFDNNGEMKTKTMVAPFEKLFDESVDTKPTYQSDEAEAQAIKDWSVDNDAMYHPLRTSYVPAGETSSAPLYIDHWDIYQLDSFTYKTENNNPKMMDDGYNLDVDLSKSVLVAQAYSSRFNYVGYEDYVVVPVYNKDKVDRQGASDKRTDSSATLLTLTRNQWNANVAGNTKGGSYINSADRVYVDFMLNYNYSVKINGKDTNILLNSTGDNIKVGFIVRSYTWENEDKHYSKAQYVLVDKAQINDKNRMEYCFGFNNTANNRKAGLYYEFKPFIVDTSNQAGSAGCDVTISGETYKALYADSTVSVLDQVSFYQLGRL